MRMCNLLTLLLSSSLFLMPLMASAAIEIGGTRVIYPVGTPSVTINLNNVGSAPSLVKSWLDNGDAKAEPGSIDVPFLLTPPLSRIEPKQGQALRLKYLGTQIAEDRESVYWLNVLDVPPQSNSDQNQLQFAVRSRIKIFVRPKGLPGSPEEAVRTLVWQLVPDGQQCTLQVRNASAFHVSAARISVPGQKNLPGRMIAPQSSERFELAECPANNNGIELRSVNDSGALIDSLITVTAL